MRNLLKFTIFSLSACLFAPAASAQGDTVAKPSPAVRFIDTHTDSGVHDIMQLNAPNHALLKDVPRFAIIGKNHKFYLGIGANLMLTGSFDWGAPLDDASKFIPADIVPAEDGNRSQVLFSAAQSDFYLNFVALPGSANQVGIFLNINFINGDHNPSLHHAYLKYRGITAGYTHSIFTDVNSKPATVDYEGPNAMTYVTHPNISYALSFGRDKMWTAAIGLGMPEYSFYNLGYTKTVRQRVPDIPVYIQRGWMGGQGYLRASALFRTLTYRNIGLKRNGNDFGWGVKLSGKTPIAGGLSAMWEGVYGHGIASYIDDLKDQHLDLTPNASNPGNLDPTPVWGAYGTLQYDFCRRFSINATYSQVRAYPERFDSAGYKWGQYITGNCFWYVNSFTTVGMEYLYGRRKDRSGLQVHDNRLMLMLKLSI